LLLRVQFARLYPLSQGDLDAEPKHVDLMPLAPSRMVVDNPSRDYCPPKFVNLLFTDLGVLTPAAVSDELIQLCALSLGFRVPDEFIQLCALALGFSTSSFSCAPSLLHIASLVLLPACT
jgi:hypothetical protein